MTITSVLDPSSTRNATPKVDTQKGISKVLKSETFKRTPIERPPDLHYYVDSSFVPLEQYTNPMSITDFYDPAAVYDFDIKESESENKSFIMDFWDRIFGEQSEEDYLKELAKNE